VNLSNFISLEGDRLVLNPKRTTAELIVHLVDDMTCSARDNPNVTVFKTCADRMEASGFKTARPFLYKRGLGFGRSAKVTVVEDVAHPPADLTHVRTDADWQVGVAKLVARSLAEACNEHDRQPERFVLDCIGAGIASKE
jgi:hypothetical protein